MLRPMNAVRNLSSDVRSSLALLAERSDRASPTVFAGREDEFDLLDVAARGAQRNEGGHTVVIQGVPGAGKTALLNEYAGRLLTVGSSTEKPIIPVPLLPGDINASPAAIVQAIDRQFREFEASDEWGRRVNRAVNGASILGNALFAAFTRKDFNDFRAAARAPDSLPTALDDYVAFRFDRRDSTIVLLVDEAQSLSDTTRVREHLLQLHDGIKGRTQVLLACFGLANTAGRLRELGLSRLATDHVRSIGALSNEDAKRTVAGTLDVAFSDFSFDDEVQCHLSGALQRERWINAAAATILAESANFPHHLTNGCRALATIALDEGIGDEPPAARLRDKCKEHKREYYDAILQPWANHATALAHALGDGSGDWAATSDVKQALMASDDFGEPVDRRCATAILRQLCAHGYVEQRAGACRPALPSLASHFEDIRHNFAPDNEVVQAVRASRSLNSPEFA